MIDLLEAAPVVVYIICFFIAYFIFTRAIKDAEKD